jgi:hypothetical protein
VDFNNEYEIYQKYTYKYDEKNNKIEEAYSDKNNHVYLKCKTKYNPNGKKKEYFLHDTNDVVYSHNVYIYNEKNYLIEEVDKIKDSVEFMKVTYKYDNMGNMIDHITLRFGKFFGRTIYKYDNKRNLIEYKYFQNRDSVGWGKSYKYDDQGNKIEYIYFYIDSSVNKLYNKWTAKYDDHINEIEKAYYNEQNEISIIEITKYDDKNNKIEKLKTLADGTIIFIATYKNGNTIEDVNFNKGVNLEYRTAYKYDDLGNCIEVVEYNELNQPDNKTEYIYSK